MVRGNDVFLAHFRDFSDRYVLIGGSACDIAMTEAGLDFRATKDLDILLWVVDIIAGLGDAYHCAPLTDTPLR